MHTPLSVPVWALLGFTFWTLLVLVFTVGSYRWGLILMGKAAPQTFKADQVEGAPWYKRSMRAHANCLENLPVFGALVFVLQTAHIGGPTVDACALAIFGARVLQSTVHISLVQSNLVSVIRFSFFAVQLMGYFTILGVIVLRST